MSGIAVMRRGNSGFSLIEVMVALVVCSIGLLGLAKMESLALSSEDVSGTRTIAAIEAASLAATMHADRGYWSSASATAGATITWSGTALSISDANLAGVHACTTPLAGACSTTQMAAYDVQTWAGASATTGLNALLPGYTATITCTPTATLSPVTCLITIFWPENAVAANSQQSNLAASSATNPSYTLNVEP